MSKAKFEAAKKFIQEKQYDKARMVLKTIDHPQAKEWLKRISDLEKGKAPKPTKKSAESAVTRKAEQKAPAKKMNPLIWGVVGLLVFGVLAVLGMLVLNQDKNEALPTAVAQQATLTGSTEALIPESTAEVTLEATESPLLSVEEATMQAERVLTALPGVVGMSGFSVQTGGSAAFDYLISTSLTVESGGNTQETADDILARVQEALHSNQIDLRVTLDDGASEPMDYRWTTEQQAWAVSRAYTAKALSEAFRTIEGVDYADSMGISNGVVGVTAYDVLVSAFVNVLPGFSHQEMADSLLQTTFKTFETQAVEFRLTLVEGTTETAFNWHDGAWQ